MSDDLYANFRFSNLSVFHVICKNAYSVSVMSDGELCYFFNCFLVCAVLQTRGNQMHLKITTMT